MTVLQSKPLTRWLNFQNRVPADLLSIGGAVSGTLCSASRGRLGVEWLLGWGIPATGVSRVLFCGCGLLPQVLVTLPLQLKHFLNSFLIPILEHVKN